MLGKRRRTTKEDAELDITSFMNLMIVLVPVLLMMMVFSRITVVELSLPDLGEAAASDSPNKQLELVVRNDSIGIYYPQGQLVKRITTDEQGYDFVALQDTLKQVKQALVNKGIEKRQATLLLEADVPYQVIVALMDTTRSYKEVVVTSVVDAELFPEISLGDAPQLVAHQSSDAGAAQ